MKKIIWLVLNKIEFKISRLKTNFKAEVIEEKNKIVSNKVGDFILSMGDKHIHNSNWLHFQYSKNLPRIVKHVTNKYSGSKVVDIGANIGDSVALIKTIVDVPVLCIEGDDYYFELLEQNIKQFKNVELFKTYLGETDEQISAKTVHAQGTLKIDNSDQSTSLKIQKFDTLVDHNPELFKNLKMLKIDTDGYDLKIIRGAKAMIKKNNPVIFFEYSEKHLKDAGEDGLSVFPFLKELGYKFVMFYDPFGRFIFSTEIENKILLKQVHLYISNYSLPLEYLDISVFHEQDQDLYKQMVDEEMEINSKGQNNMVQNRLEL